MKKEEFERRVLMLWAKSNIPLTRANLQVLTGASAKVVKQRLEEMMAAGVLSPGTDEDDELVWQVNGAQRPVDGPRTFAELQRLLRLNAQVSAELKIKQEQARAAEEAERQRRLEAEQAKAALVLAKKQELTAGADDDDTRLAATEPDDDDQPGFLSRLFGRKKFGAVDALEVVGEARREIDQPKPKKEKSLLWSGGLSFFLGPVGWLYAGSWREAIPGSLLYLGAAAILQKFPAFLLMPIMSIALPLSGLIGVGYAWQYNRKGGRQRLLGGKKKQLKA